MSPEQKRKFNTAAGAALLASGVLAWAFAAYFAVSPAAMKPAPTYGENVIDLQSCAQTLRELGFPEVNAQADDVTTFEPLSAAPLAQLERATLASAVCKLEMKSFCMGDSCPRPGLTLVVSRPSAMRQAAKEAAAKDLEQKVKAAAKSAANATSASTGSAAKGTDKAGAKKNGAQAPEDAAP